MAPRTVNKISGVIAHPLLATSVTNRAAFTERKILAAFIAAVTLLCVAGGVVYRMSVELEISGQRVVESLQVQATLRHLSESIARCESAHRSYLLSGAQTYRTEFGRIAVQVDSDLATLRRLIGSSPAQLERLDLLLLVVRRHMKALSDLLDILENRGKEAATLATPPDYGVSTLNAIRRQTALIEDFEERSLRQRVTTLARYGSHPFIVLMLTMSAAMFGLASLFGSVVRDIREHKRVTHALEDAQREARRATHAKSDFLAAMSHEIRTPMNGVIGLIDVLQESGLARAQSEMVKLIRQSSDSLLRIIDDILDFSKIEAGRLEVERVPISIAEAVETTGELLNRLAELKHVTLTMFVDPQIPSSLLGDSTRLQQVLVNLTNNAIKFSSGQAAPGRVSLRATLVEHAPALCVVEFRVQDNGIGMDGTTLARVFTSFTQADASTTRRHGGTGLGLCIARQLTLLMGGEISVQTEAGHGATFLARIPFGTASCSELQAKPPAPLAGLRCAILGKEPELAEDLARYLEADGAVVHCVPDLAAAAQWTRQHDDTLTVWVVDNFRAVTNLAEISAAREACEITPDRRIALVSIGRGRRRIPRQQTGIIVVDGNVLARRTLSKAVGMAAGRASNDCENFTEPPMARSPAPTRDEAIREDRLILLVEDNDMNQNVICRQLDLLGYAVDVARNGREALQCFQASSYALVITDLHMPEMDGYELAMAIRVSERGRSRIPIIAVTANALAGEAERCRDMGMDAYLSKPLTLARLASGLSQWLPAKTGTEAATTPSAPAIDSAVLESLIGNDAHVVAGFMGEFARSLECLGAELSRACTSRNTGDAAINAHKLKSCARSVGAVRLGAVCEEIESAGNTNNVARLAALHPRLETELAAVEGALGATNGSAGPRPAYCN